MQQKKGHCIKLRRRSWVNEKQRPFLLRERTSPEARCKPNRRNVLRNQEADEKRDDCAILTETFLVHNLAVCSIDSISSP